MKKGSENNVNIKNKRAYFDYEIEDKYVAGIELVGTEIKSIRYGKASIRESFCEFKNDELYVVNMNIEEYSHGTHSNHLPKRTRKLLLQKRELKQLAKAVEIKGYSIIPLRIFINDRGYAKMEIGLGKGKKLYDKRESIKKRDTERSLKRVLKL